MGLRRRLTGAAGCRTASTFRRFDPLRARLARELDVRDAVLDGEIACLDEEGRSLFNPLLFHRREPVYAVFDVVWLNGADLRAVPLIDRKRRLRALLPPESAHLLHVDWLPARGKELFALACEKDLEGVAGKWASGTYQGDGIHTSWIR